MTIKPMTVGVLLEKLKHIDPNTIIHVRDAGCLVPLTNINHYGSVETTSEFWVKFIGLEPRLVEGAEEDRKI